MPRPRPLMLPALLQMLVVSMSLLLPATDSAGQTVTILHSFEWGEDGAYPQAGLVMDAEGNLYGTTVQGATGDLGTVFEVAPNGVETVLYHNFSGWRGWGPSATLVRDQNGTLYGTTFQGGGGPCDSGFGCGTVFLVRGNQNGRVLHHFKPGFEGWGPNGSLILDSAGNLYGTTVYGGVHGVGTIFKIAPDRTFTVVYSFDGEHGSTPFGGLVRDDAGNFYGTTQYGGSHDCGTGSGCGTVFKITPFGEETVLHSFSGSPDGSYPVASLVLDPQGNLYGTTEGGGAHGMGMVFEVNSAGEEQILYSFKGGADGGRPAANLVRDRSGNLYGVTSMDGMYTFGTVFKLTRNGKKEVLHSFSGYPDDGGYPMGALVLDTQGNLYGTTSIGGANRVGIVFKFTP